NSKRRPDRPLHTTKIKTQKVLENPIFIGISSTFITSNCQSWDYIGTFSLFQIFQQQDRHQSVFQSAFHLSVLRNFEYLK
ncbi:MAG: hypothetical protein LKG62_03025, partial [Solobacterium sp.]|nr:hypothetical protein [Solobacterium sp.]MCI1362897.1 hypothetical protein [Solobacterium sp.]MCI1433594.1 hypothetical protein [Solobacterium sp.]